jgi:3D (Asp-Asp-Asp) domain-containing protein
MIKFTTKKALIVIAVLFALQLTLPQYSYAYGLNRVKLATKDSELMIASFMEPVLDDSSDNKLPVAGEREPIRVIKAITTAYSSTPDQTDSTPFITANGSHVRDGIVATNMFPFGTKVRFPDVYGDKVFSVEDRMHTRFSDRFDIWMETREEAIIFGAQYVTIEVF